MADKDLQMQRKKSDGTFDKYYPKTKTHLVVDDTTGQTIKEQYNNIVDGIVIVNKAENAINSENANKLENKSASEFAKTSHSHIKSEIIDFPSSLPANGGTSASCSGNAATATKLQTARAINNVSFDGTANITVADSTKAPISHASTISTYGLGTTTNYGHVKIVNDLIQSSHIDGSVLSAYQGKVLNDRINGLLPNSLTFTSSGTWVCPHGISRAYAVLIGGGGNGTIGTGGSTNDAGYGGSGGRSGNISFIVGRKVTSGASYPYIIGGVSGTTNFLGVSADGYSSGGSGGRGARNYISGYFGQSAEASAPGSNSSTLSRNDAQVSETTYYTANGAGGGGGGGDTYGRSAGGTATNGSGAGGAGGAAGANGAAGGAATGYGCGGGGGGGGGTGATSGGAGGAGKQGVIYMWYE